MFRLEVPGGYLFYVATVNVWRAEEAKLRYTTEHFDRYLFGMPSLGVFRVVGKSFKELFTEEEFTHWLQEYAVNAGELGEDDRGVIWTEKQSVPKSSYSPFFTKA
ncbi:hypothetical protein DH09_13990 [Bacillaceae bacterium JMAK1]|nr:hypothetical protein DH09_13990 [Bacillaceae bacterium JMAK1]